MVNAEPRSEKEISRRQVLAGAGMLTAGMAMATGFGVWPRAAAAHDLATDKWPWPYEKLDPEKTAEIAYDEWYRVFCGAGVINSIFGQLREKIGEPYTLIPVEAFIFLEGGMTGWGTVCGSNAGAAIVTNLIIGPRTSGSHDGPMMGSEIMQWYSESPLPTYTPKEPKFKGEMITTVSDSPLCHVSVGRWMKAAGQPLGSAGRRDRCARVTASVAYQTVKLLNDWKDGKYQTRGEMPSKAYGITAQHNCTGCHGSEAPSPPAAGK